MIERMNFTITGIELNVKCIKVIVYDDILTLLASKIKCIAINSLLDYSNRPSCIQYYKKRKTTTNPDCHKGCPLNLKL